MKILMTNKFLYPAGGAEIYMLKLGQYLQEQGHQVEYFGMYHADQYVAPEGQYTTVHSADGAAWYKQYAVDTVEKSPYMAPDGSIAYNESIVKKAAPHSPQKGQALNG